MATQSLTHGTTTGGSLLPRVYDRLRKRSHRRLYAWYFNEALDDPAWMGRQHAAYVAGVLDALNAVQEGA